MLRKGFFFTPKDKKIAIAPRLNPTRQVGNHHIEEKTGLVRSIRCLMVCVPLSYSPSLVEKMSSYDQTK